jgi:hypothetical protein
MMEESRREAQTGLSAIWVSDWVWALLSPFACGSENGGRYISPLPCEERGTGGYVSETARSA